MSAAGDGGDRWDQLPLISAPTLILHGSDDPISPAENASLLGSRIRDSTVHIVAGGRHGIVREFRSEVAHAILEFLGQHPLA